MGLFNRLRNAEPAKAAAPKETKAASGGSVVVKKTSAHGALLLTTPRVSEKSAALASRGTYVFNVPISANKVEVRKAVEGLYGVNVESVRMIRGIGKIIRRGRIAGQRAKWKKALVTVKPGQKLDLYEGV